MDDFDQTTAEHSAHEQAPEQPALSMAQRLRAFEDKVFGEDAVRIEGKIEKGSGSPHKMAPIDVKAHHAALENAIEAEKALGEARGKLTEAENAVAAAEARVNATGMAHEEAEDKRPQED
jgi:hypothetical protein